MIKYFLTSKYTEDINKFIVESCFKDFIKNKKDKNFFQIHRIKIAKDNDFVFLFIFLFKFFFIFLWSKKNLLFDKYDGVNYGRYLISYTFKDFRCYKSRIFFNIQLFYKKN